ncbi:PAS/PAC sensor signal transduction histidine kinase [Dehalogenimonas lykanthroporepellens BL-DC-9]|nr:PAS/PAC sensor signal transduction histidine kinase [Dehalogenimonas lykanthroporepellens BL-DC-9]
MEQAVSPDSLGILKQALDEAMTAIASNETAPESRYFQVEQPCKDGSTVWTEVSASLVLDEGKPSYVLGVSRNITGRLRTETELRRSEEKYRQLFNSINDAIYFHEIGDDGRGRFIEVNEGATRLMGYNRDEFLAMSPVVLDGPDAVEDATAVRQAMEKEGHAVFERVHVTRDGRRIPVEISSRSVHIDGNTMYLSVVRDITERKAMEARLEQAASQWRATFDAITTPISIQNRQYRILQVNRAFAEAMKSSPQDLIGRTCFEVSHGTTEPVPTCPHRRTLESGQAEQVEVHNAELNTDTRISTYPMFGADGEIIASVHITEDITEQRKMQEQLMVTNRLASVGELAAGIAHEINNPLTGILGFSELLMENNLPENLRADVETIHSEANRAAGIIKNLLVFARQHHQVREELDVNEVVERVLTLRAYEANLNNIQVVRHLAPDIPMIIGDHFQLQQVFLNLVINAEYFMLKAHNKGTLTVATSYDRETERVRLVFTDDGPGVAPDIQARLFDPFFTTKDVGQGTGLGLSISHGVIKQHGGTIRVESQPGQGASFIIELPLKPSPEEAVS